MVVMALAFFSIAVFISGDMWQIFNPQTGEPTVFAWRVSYAVGFIAFVFGLFAHFRFNTDRYRKTKPVFREIWQTLLFIVIYAIVGFVYTVVVEVGMSLVGFPLGRYPIPTAAIYFVFAGLLSYWILRRYRALGMRPAKSSGRTEPYFQQT